MLNSEVSPTCPILKKEKLKWKLKTGKIELWKIQWTMENLLKKSKFMEMQQGWTADLRKHNLTY